MANIFPGRYTGLTDKPFVLFLIGMRISQHWALPNMPSFGLAAATGHVPALGNRETARRRLGVQSETAGPSPPTPLRDGLGQ